MKIKTYDRQSAVNYAKKWAYGRNPNYYDFENVGGDCTSFASQCIYAGSNVMNYNKINGWYYKNGNDKTPSWSGVEFLYSFLVTNKGIGPYGFETSINEIEVGDIAQLKFEKSDTYGHTLFIIDTKKPINLSNILIATHTFDIYGKQISKYDFSKIRFIHIDGVRIQ